MDQRIVYAGVGLGVVGLLVVASKGGGGSGSSSRMTTLGPLPSADDGANASARTSAFTKLADVYGAVELGKLDSFTRRSLGAVQQDVENRRTAGAVESARLQAEAAQKVALAQIKANKKDFWDKLSSVGDTVGKIIPFL